MNNKINDKVEHKIVPLLKKHLEQMFSSEDNSLKNPWTKSDFIKCSYFDKLNEGFPIYGYSIINIDKNGLQQYDELLGCIAYNEDDSTIYIVNVGIKNLLDRLNKIGNELIGILQKEVINGNKLNIIVGIHESDLIALDLFKSNGFNVVKTIDDEIILEYV